MSKAFVRAMKSAGNTTHTENGAVTHKSALSNVLDFFYHAPASRGQTQKIIDLFRDAYNEDEVTAMKALFYLRDIRGGQGERKSFRVCLRWLAENHPETVRNVMKLVPEYGRYDDLWVLFDTKCEDDMINFVKFQLNSDLHETKF